MFNCAEISQMENFPLSQGAKHSLRFLGTQSYALTDLISSTGGVYLCVEVGGRFLKETYSRLHTPLKRQIVIPTESNTSSFANRQNLLVRRLDVEHCPGSNNNVRVARKVGQHSAHRPIHGDSSSPAFPYNRNSARRRPLSSGSAFIPLEQSHERR